MTLDDLYTKVGGSYGDAIAYLRSERLASRLLVRFLDDTSCARLLTAWDEHDWDGAFRAAHEAKGVCANLYLTKLAALADDVTEALRPQVRTEESVAAVADTVEELREAYYATIDAIAAYVAAQP